MATHILYLTFDLCDAATWRRVSMLKMGGARVTVAGFHRNTPPQGDKDTHVIPLGHTENGRFTKRIMAVLRARLKLKATLAKIDPPDILLARNLETLALAPRIKKIYPHLRGVVYECLDIHRLQLGQSIPSRLVRTVERHLLGYTNLILTSSPAFVRNYFFQNLNTHIPVKIVENKCLPDQPVAKQPSRRGPIRIGWFGVLRCKASLECLDAFTRRHPGAFRVILRGKPSLNAIPDFYALVKANADMSYEGPYKAEDLSKIYGEVHLSWGIDRYEAGANSEWLLPNRLYEGSCFGAVPIALKGTETARFLDTKGLGVIVSGVQPGALAAIANITHDDVSEYREHLLAAPSDLWAFTQADCVDLVETLAHANSIQPGTSAKMNTEVLS